MGFLDRFKRKKAALEVTPAKPIAPPPKAPVPINKIPPKEQTLAAPRRRDWDPAPARRPAQSVPTSPPIRNVVTKSEPIAIPSQRERLTEEPNFGTWVDPKVTPPTEEWERRLNNYARKCARQLLEAGVPLFRSEWPRGGERTYRDAFWLIACDVEVGDRSYVAHFFITEDPRRPPGLPPLPKQGEYVGHFSGDALLLTKSGILCSAEVDGFFTRSGGLDDREMDMVFSNIARPMDRFRWHDWGWNNRGRWRRDPRSDIKLDGVDIFTQSIRFDKKWSNKPSADDGRDTSAALSAFVKSNGKVRWPRGFAGFHYD